METTVDAIEKSIRSHRKSIIETQIQIWRFESDKDLYDKKQVRRLKKQIKASYKRIRKLMKRSHHCQSVELYNTETEGDDA